MSSGGSGVFGNPDLRALAADHLIFESMAPRIFNGATYPWASITAGDHDAEIHTFAARMRDLGVPVLFTVNQEFDGGGLGANAVGDYVPMWRHVRGIVRDQEGANNVRFAWVPTGWSGNWSRLPAMYPGDEDAVCWDPYRSSSPSGTADVDPYGFYEHLESRTWLNQSSPRLLAEWGVVEGAGRPAWLQGIPASIRGLPKLVGVCYFDSPSYLTVVLDDAASQQAFAQAGHDPYLTHP